MARVQVSAAQALKVFKTPPMVQVAKAARIPVADGEGNAAGERDGYVVETTSCRAEHVLAAAQYDDHVAIVTIDGKRHEAKGTIEPEAKGKKGENEKDAK